MLLAVLQYNFPVFSSVLLLIAGILIGYALWLPFRGDSENILRQLDGLADQNDDLEKALRDQRDAYVQLERRHAQQQDEWAYLRTWHERVESTLKEQGLANGSIEQGLAALHDLKEHAIRELDIERKRRTDTEDQLRESKCAVEQMRVDLEDYRNLQSTYDSLSTDFASLKQEHTQLLGVQDALKRSAEEATQQLLAQVDSNADDAELSAKIDQLSHALEIQQQRSEELQRERGEVLNQLQNERDQRCDLEEILHAKERELADALTKTDEADQDRVAELEGTLEEAASDFRLLASERDRAIARLDDAHGEIKKLHAEVDSHRRAFDTVERHRSELSLNSRRENEAKQAGMQELQMMRQEIGQLKAELALMHTLKQQNASLDRQYKALQESHQDNQRTLAQLKVDRDETATRLEKERTEREQIAARIEQQVGEVEDLRTQREDVLRNLREEQALRREAEHALDAQAKRLAQIGREALDVGELQDEIQSLRTRLATAEGQFEEAHDERRAAQQIVESARETIYSLQSQLAANEQSIQTLKTNSQGIQERYDQRIEQLTMERNQARKSVELAEEKMAELQDQMADLHSTVAELRREREDVLTRLRRQTVMLESHMANSASDEIGEEYRAIGPVRRDERMGIVYTARPSQTDDLKKISGIAAVLEQKLNQFGVYTYRQIIDWDEVAIEEFSTLLMFRDRIERDDWQGQAQHLYQEKYSRAA